MPDPQFADSVVQKQSSAIQNQDKETSDSNAGISISPPAYQNQTTQSTQGNNEGEEASNDPLVVESGQMTFDSEGNDDSDSIYFSRVVHWPGGASGVTIGRGYDMKFRTGDEIYSDLVNAGVEESVATLLRGASLKEGDSAKQWVTDNKTAIGTISAEAQKKLFEVVYAEYEEKAERLATKDDVTAAYGETDWENTHPAIKELLVDLRYRGDYKPSTRVWIQSDVANNDLAALTTKMNDERWKTEFGVPSDRFNRRKDFMNEALAAFNNGEGEQEVSPENIQTTDDLDNAAGGQEEQAAELGRVHLYSNRDNSFSSSRWTNRDGSTTGYAETFAVKIQEELRTEFGRDITHEQVLAMIEEAQANGNEAQAEEYRIRLFRANQYAVVETLNVDQTTSDGATRGENAMGRDFRSANNHEMYGKTRTSRGNQTYCNIYAYDVVTAMGAFLPRVWWTSRYEQQAIAALESGTNFDVQAEYGNGITREMNANSLTEWMHDIGDTYYGWDKADMPTAQAAANNGQIAIILAKKKDGSSGHVNVILAERDQHQASRNAAGEVDRPLQSQAGGSNFKYQVHNSAWWAGTSYELGGAWVHSGNIDSPLLSPQEMGIAGAENQVDTAAGETETTAPPSTAAPTTATPTTADNSGSSNTNPATYEVQSGETIQILAARFGVSVAQLSSANRVHEFRTSSGRVVYGFMAGQEITIPGGQAISPETTSSSEQEVTPASAPVTTEVDQSDITALQVSQKLYKAMHLTMFSTGMGTDEAGIYSALGQLNHDQEMIDAVKAKYSFLYKRDLVADLNGELSDSYLFGNQLTRALELINMSSTESAEQAAPTQDQDAEGIPLEVAKSDLKNKLQDDEFPIVADLLTKDQHTAQAAGSTNCNEIAIGMIMTYLKAEGYDTDEFVIGSGLSTKKHSLHLAREKHESLTGSDEKKKVFEELGVKNHAKRIRSYDEGLLEKDDEHKQAVQYITSNLSEGIPVLVGIDHTYSRTLKDKKVTSKNSSYTKATYNEGTTDHWIVVVGSGIDNGQKYFTYFDPGRGSGAERTEKQGDGGNTEWNRLVQSNVAGEEHIWRDADGAMRGEYGYTLTAVSKYNKDREDTKYQVQKELRRLGFYDGKIDGDIGKGSKEAIKAFQEANGMEVNTTLSSELLETLRNS